VTDKAKLVELMRTSINEAEKAIRDHADGFNELMTGLDGKQMPKIAFLLFGMSHEMYHRGQVASYARQLGLVPAMTQRTAPKPT